MSDNHNLFEVNKGNKGMRQVRYDANNPINQEQLRSYIFEAIEIDKRGLKISTPKAKTSLTKSNTKSEDFIVALKKNKTAFDFFESLTDSQKNGFSLHVEIAKQIATKEKRILRCIELLEKGLKTIY